MYCPRIRLYCQGFRNDRKVLEGIAIGVGTVLSFGASTAAKTGAKTAIKTALKKMSKDALKAAANGMKNALKGKFKDITLKNARKKLLETVKDKLKELPKESPPTVSGPTIKLTSKEINSKYAKLWISLELDSMTKLPPSQ